MFAPRTTPGTILAQMRVFGADVELVDGRVGLLTRNASSSFDSASLQTDDPAVPGSTNASGGPLGGNTGSTNPTLESLSAGQSAFIPGMPGIPGIPGSPPGIPGPPGIPATSPARRWWPTSR